MSVYEETEDVNRGNRVLLFRLGADVRGGVGGEGQTQL